MKLILDKTHKNPDQTTMPWIDAIARYEQKSILWIKCDMKMNTFLNPRSSNDFNNPL